MKNTADIPVFRLRFIEDTPAGRKYIVLHESSAEPVQELVILFNRDAYSVSYLSGPASFSGYLKENEKKLLKILSTSMTIESPKNINIPFSFYADTEPLPLPDEAIEVYTDGSLSQTGTGGWACAIVSETVERFTGYETNSSSNRMELMAVCMGLDHLSPAPMPVIVHTDSMYVIKGAQIWLGNWLRNGFMTAQNREVKNRDLWEKLAELIERDEIHFNWIPSSSENEHHQWCDMVLRRDPLKTGKKFKQCF